MFFREKVINGRVYKYTMNQTSKNLMAVGGVISTIVGIVIAIPNFLIGNYPLATGSVILIVGGIILLAIAFGD